MYCSLEDASTEQTVNVMSVRYSRRREVEERQLVITGSVYVGTRYRYLPIFVLHYTVQVLCLEVSQYTLHSAPASPDKK